MWWTWCASSVGSPSMGDVEQRATISIVVPARNEEATIGEVVSRSFAAMDAMGRRGEVLVVNDGSSDGTGQVLAQLQAKYPYLRVQSNRRSRWMTSALERMFAGSTGDIVILIPADMESDPLVDIPALVNHMEATDLDVVAGWRQGRKDSKVFASNIYNLVMRSLMAVPVHDGNWIKAMRRDVVESLPPLRSDWHRFILMIAAHQGYSIGEVQTYYQPRPAGSSKFGISRIPISLLDVLVLRFLLSFSQAPMRFFGGIGLAGMSISLLTFLYLTVLYLATDTQKRPIFLAAGILAVISVILFVVGFLAELIVTQGERIYALEKKMAARARDDDGFSGTPLSGA
jgi:glycosyltransferase involved in cell wall biosynthesis